MVTQRLFDPADDFDGVSRFLRKCYQPHQKERSVGEGGVLQWLRDDAKNPFSYVHPWLSKAHHAEKLSYGCNAQPFATQTLFGD